VVVGSQILLLKYRNYTDLSARLAAGRAHRSLGDPDWTVGSSDFDKIFENCFASCSFGLAKDK
jgi:hypothetical protein